MTAATHENGSAAALWQSINDELAAELREAVYVVVDVADEDALLRLDYSVCLAGQHARGWGFLLGVGAADVVLVGRAAADGWWFHKLAADAPSVRLYVLDVQSPALALGLGTPRALKPAEFNTLRATWDRIVIEGARRENWSLPRSLTESHEKPLTRCRHVR